MNNPIPKRGDPKGPTNTGHETNVSLPEMDALKVTATEGSKLPKINFKKQPENSTVITFINKKPKTIENPVSAMTLDDFRKYVDEMKKMKRDDQLIPQAYGENKRDVIIHDTLRACVDFKIAEKKMKR